MRPEVNLNQFEISKVVSQKLLLLSKVVPFTWQSYCEQASNLKPHSKIVPFTWRFYCANFPNY